MEGSAATGATSEELIAAIIDDHMAALLHWRANPQTRNIMKLFFSPTSPYVRKCLVVAHELGLAGRIEFVASNAHPVTRDQTIIAKNPLGKVPTLIADDGLVLYDSRVICEYLNDLAGGKVFPASGKARWEALTLQSLADGILHCWPAMKTWHGLKPSAGQNGVPVSSTRQRRRLRVWKATWQSWPGGLILGHCRWLVRCGTWICASLSCSGVTATPRWRCGTRASASGLRRK
jgi:hypothetical protein